ncbi:hypothetical protein OROHE_007678 [Orobanche hederae]
MRSFMYEESSNRKHIEAREEREKDLEVKTSNEKVREMKQIEFEHGSQVITGELVEERKMVAMEDFV